jgi:hypothetical protein
MEDGSIHLFYSVRKVVLPFVDVISYHLPDDI